eukprot:TRINITY_DN36741_c0_g1_i1.p1 TRINITY_DN36741_c0_g1~~TRINITY_DN36741_c0_g1_i1.p1  ORF type:complete len:914 (+),score=191.33 TRINITY_DN36741_c0_g1_i1:247-2988(+)
MLASTNVQMGSDVPLEPEHGEQEDAAAAAAAAEAAATAQLYAGFGDLSDVPPANLEEVEMVLEALQELDPSTLGIDGLRKYLQLLSRMQGFSREATLQILTVLVQCMTSSGGPVSMESIQQGFVRMGGVKQTIHVLLLRLSDAAVVAKCAQTLAAGVQGSPLSAEAMLNSGGGDVRLLLRAIERHVSDDDVALQGCTLISNICAELPRPDTDVQQARARAHRECQRLIAESGAIDLLVEVLTTSLDKVKEVATKAQKMYDEHTSNMGGTSVVVRKRPGKGGAKPKADLAKGNKAEEIRAAWAKVGTVEGSSAKVQDSALQALVLVACANPDTIRILAGVFWMRGKLRQAEEEKTSPPLPGGKGGGVPLEGKLKNKDQSKARQSISSTGKHSARSSSRHSRSSSKISDVGSVLDSVDTYKLGTIDSLALTLMLPIEVLQSQTAKDRPALGAKACRLLSMICELHLKMAAQVEEAARVHSLRTTIHNDPSNSSMDQAPFALLEPIIGTLVHNLHLQNHDVPLISSALTGLMQLRSIVLRTAPPGGDIRTVEVRQAWGKLLSDAQKNNELRKAAQALEHALHQTEVGNQRLGRGGLHPSELTGDGSWLTPRMRDSAQKSVMHAYELISDTLTKSWSKGEPGREEKLTKAREDAAAAAAAAAKAAAEAAAEAQGKSSGKGRGKGKKVKGIKFDSSSSSSSEEEAEASHQKSKGKKGKGKGRGKGKNGTFGATEDEEDAQWKASRPWVRALGFGVHDEEDFDRIWRQPLTEVFGRSFSQPAIRSGADIDASGKAAGSSNLPRKLDTTALEGQDDMSIDFLESAPGKLRVRVVVPSRNKVRQNVNDIRMQHLLDQNFVARGVTQEIAKQLRNKGCLMPKYGLQVSIRKGGGRVNRIGTDDSSPKSTVLEDSTTKLPPLV